MLLLASNIYVCATVIVQANDPNSPKGFNTPISAQGYDRLKGNFFVGLVDGTDAYTISKAGRPSFTSPAVFTGILGTQSMLRNTSIDLLTISEQEKTKSVVAAVSTANPLKIVGLFDDGTSELDPANLAAINDASGSQTQGILGITASSSHIFAMVEPNSGSFGDSGTGIAMVGVNIANNTLTFDIKNAVTGVNGNLAVGLDETSSQLGSGNVLFDSSEVGLYWDTTFQRLYIGLQLVSDSGVADIVKSVAVGRLNPSALVIEPIVADSAITSGMDELIVGEGADLERGVQFPRVMHTSTGPDYLVVDCARTSSDCNRVFALPLVYDTSSPSDHGTLAAKESTLTNFKFTTPATSSGDLPINDPITDASAIVGAGDLPIQPDQFLADMVVVGDGVYVAINETPTDDNDTGVFFSQALFGDDGRIIRWTPWVKRGVPLNAFPGQTLPGNVVHDGKVRFLEVDGKTGNIWIVEGDTQQVVGITSWSVGAVTTGLLNQLNLAFPRGCYSALDLHQATRGFLDTTINRYAAFGGVDRVVFARVSQATDISSISSPQTLFTDFTDDADFLSTRLPDPGGCCTVLEYSRTSTTAGDENNLNYFFAGTENGLYVYARDETNSGFNALALGSMTAAPFNSNVWKRIEAINGAIVDLKTTGTGPLYVLTFQSTEDEPIKSTLWSIPHKSTTGAMFSPSNLRIIAQTGVAPFTSVSEFFGIQVVATGQPDSTDPQEKEQLIMATNQGLFCTDSPQVGGQGIASATNQTEADWAVVVDGENTTAQTMFFGIAGIDTPIRHTAWPISVQDGNGFMTFDRGSIHQLSGNGTFGSTQGNPALFNPFFVPKQFNSRPQTTTLKTLDPTIYFHSDGGRRFLIFNRTQDPVTQLQLAVLPYNINTWSVTNPEIITHPTLANFDRYFWIKQIGSTGILMMGTENGVVGLE